MQILAHRGMWKTNTEKNTYKAFERALQNGFGIETDIRDYCGELVISHDIADVDAISLSTLLELYKELRATTTLALNVKSDGIQGKLQDLLKKYEIKNYFVFDMSIPELVVYRERGIRFFTRESDIERECVMYTDAQGVWMDSFYDFDWITSEQITAHVTNEKKPCIVSPELHGREYLELWQLLKNERYQGCMLCTDYPEKAKEYFNEED